MERVTVGERLKEALKLRDLSIILCRDFMPVVEGALKPGADGAFLVGPEGDGMDFEFFPVVEFKEFSHQIGCRMLVKIG